MEPYCCVNGVASMSPYRCSSSPPVMHWKTGLTGWMPVLVEVLLIVGGALYSIGGVLYALKWPNPWPRTFGHHEFFHACTAVAAICHYIAMWFAVF